jgi:hypothetical protein
MSGLAEKRLPGNNDPDTFWRPTRMPGTEAKAKLILKNQTGKKVYLCCGKSEYTLEQNQSIEIEIQDGDCMCSTRDYGLNQYKDPCCYCCIGCNNAIEMTCSFVCPLVAEHYHPSEG